MLRMLGEVRCSRSKAKVSGLMFLVFPKEIWHLGFVIRAGYDTSKDTAR